MHQSRIHVNHLGFLCDAEKIAIVSNPAANEFQVEDLAINDSSTIAGRETFRAVYTGSVEQRQTDMGVYGICDFSRLQKPGIYRLSMPGHEDVLSYQFVIADGVFHALPPAFSNFLCELRSGSHSSYLRQATHLDDAVRSDNGEQIDGVGGWYDAGDSRKWMSHSTLAAWGLQAMASQLPGTAQGRRDRERMVAEIPWGLGIIPKLQDPINGMIYEDIGSGGKGRLTPGMEWWYENHAGCCVDNTENRFTDNLPGSGDERRVRIQYNPITQYTSITTLSRGVQAEPSSEQQDRWRKCAERIWQFINMRTEDDFHTWSSVKAWRLLAAIHSHETDIPGAPDPGDSLQSLQRNFDDTLGYWRFSDNSNEPHRGIIHAAQPIIALGEFLRVFPSHALAQEVRRLLLDVLERYVLPLTATNPYGFMPYGCYQPESKTEGDHYRSLSNGLFYRFCMPVHHPQQVNHGLAGHWMTWAYALALSAEQTGEQEFARLAWRQIYWLTGMNDLDVCFISGFGYNNPMPHSRFFGTIPGGFMNGFRGTPEDIPYVDLKRECEWNSTEYWNVPLSYCLLALSKLLPDEIPEARKLGKA